jgi:hypothetical protein
MSKPVRIVIIAAVVAAVLIAGGLIVGPGGGLNLLMGISSGR